MKSNDRTTCVKAWEYIKKLNSNSSKAFDKVALKTGIAEYTYGEMFDQWEKYASVFSALRMTDIR